MHWQSDRSKWPSGEEPPACSPSREALQAEDFKDRADELMEKAKGAPSREAEVLYRRYYVAQDRYRRMMVNSGSSLLRREDMVHPEHSSGDEIK